MVFLRFLGSTSLFLAMTLWTPPAAAAIWAEDESSTVWNSDPERIERVTAFADLVDLADGDNSDVLCAERAVGWTLDERCAMDEGNRVEPSNAVTTFLVPEPACPDLLYFGATVVLATALVRRRWFGRAI